MKNKQVVKRIGLSMQVDKASGYDELRDALAWDWQKFMKNILPEVKWIPIPNLKEDVVSFIENWKIQGIILTGGNNISSVSEKDITDRAVLSYSVTKNMPVFGICRGLQIIQVYFGGELDICCKEIHVAKEHPVYFSKDTVEKYNFDNEIIVNSYHKYGIRKEKLVNDIVSFAETQDGWVEGVKAKKYPIQAVLWHPERGRPFREYDSIIIRDFFGWQ